jgi:hypothetical protein
MHVESHRGDETRQVLIDFGFTPEALNNNLALIGVKPAGLDALVLSHVCVVPDVPPRRSLTPLAGRPKLIIGHKS